MHKVKPDRDPKNPLSPVLELLWYVPGGQACSGMQPWEGSVMAAAPHHPPRKASSEGGGAGAIGPSQGTKGAGISTLVPRGAVGCGQHSVWGTCAPFNSLLLHKHAAIIALVAFLANIFTDLILIEYLWEVNTMEAQIQQIYEWEMIFSSSSPTLGLLWC